jgi:valyl-tRNA synthetase
MGRDCAPLAHREIGGIISEISADELDIDDSAILQNLIKFCSSVDRQLEIFEVNGAVNLIQSFFWNEYCDWYVEASKERLRAGNVTVGAVHDLLMRQLLLILNPFIPFISDELWNTGCVGDPRSMQNVYCETADDLEKLLGCLHLSDVAAVTVAKLREFVNAARRLLVRSPVPGTGATFCVLPKDAESKEIVGGYGQKLRRLIGIAGVEFVEEAPRLQSEQTPFGLVFLKGSAIDDAAACAKIEEEIGKISAMIALNEAKLTDENFIKRAPEAVVAGARKMLGENVAKRDELQKALAALRP